MNMYGANSNTDSCMYFGSKQSGNGMGTFPKQNHIILNLTSTHYRTQKVHQIDSCGFPEKCLTMGIVYTFEFSKSGLEFWTDIT